MNATERQQQFSITAQGLPGLTVESGGSASVEATESLWLPVRLQLPWDAAPAGSHAIQFEVRALDASGQLSEKSVFLVPR